MKTARLHSAPWIDDMFGGGLAPSSLILLGGHAGMGATTLALQIAKSLSPILYVATDGDESTVASRVGVKLKQLRIMHVTAGECAKTIACINDYGAAAKPAVAVCDARVRSQDLLKLVRAMSALAWREEIPVIVITGMTKDGDIPGSITAQHEADVLITIEDDDDEGLYAPDMRTIRVWKNRYGVSTPRSTRVRMTAKGLKHLPGKKSAPKRA